MDTKPIGDRLVSWLRTVVPGLWSSLIAYLVSLGLPAGVTDALDGLGRTVLVPLVFAGVYALLRAVEAKLPAWATRLLLGSAQTPSYGTSTDGTPVVTSLEEPPAGRPAVGSGR
ncbi:hypothetical protein [Amycolatopsis solani]|uniref:hypothetical protein n=1 Tax=Amycolatopsis solani TaxID=3028615 RepID=UPI0025B14CAB|nr:hypothetical protein [Amycolatopsis sp. MEP2-6]